MVVTRSTECAGLYGKELQEQQTTPIDDDNGTSDDASHSSRGSDITPTTKRFIRDNEEDMKQKALEELLKTRAGNGGKSRRGDIQRVVKKYQNAGYKYITKGVLIYRILL